MKRNRARTDSRQQVVGIFRGKHQDQMLRRLFQNLEQRIGRLLVGAIDVVDQKNAARALQRLELRALLEQTHLLDGDLAQRAVRWERQEVGMSGEQQRIFIAFVGGPFLALGDGVGVVLQAEIVLFDFLRAANQRRRESPRQRGFAHALRTVQQNGLRDALLPRHCE